MRTAAQLAASAVIALVAQASVRAQSDLFMSPQNFGCGGDSPWSLSVGDFNGDGTPDLATANSGSSSVGVLLGLGTGGLGFAAAFPVAQFPQSVVVADFDSDGQQDVACANISGAAISVLMGQGNGGFDATVSYAFNQWARCVAVGDFDGNGSLDLATTLGGGMGIFFGLGDGTFSVGATSTFSAFDPRALAVGDFNSDGKQDVAAANAAPVPGTVVVLLGNGAGAFGSPTSFAVGSSPESIAVGDFNADGIEDLVAANAASHTVSVLIGQGNGSFGTSVPFAVAPFPGGVATGDLNGDGRQDIVTSSEGSNSITVLLGDGAGGFAPGAGHNAGNPTLAIAVGDFDGNGGIDVAATKSGSDSICILLNKYSAVWTDLGDGLAGTSGQPHLTASGPLVSATPLTLTLSQAKGFSLAPLVVGVTAIHAPFKGGVMVPNPDLLLWMFTDFFGGASLAGPWPAGVPSNITIFFQWWVADAAGPMGFAASNAVSGITP